MLAEGEYATECYFVLQGCVHSYYLSDGEEKNKRVLYPKSKY
ncbi:hypothetical protein [Maribellus comscasis]